MNGRKVMTVTGEVAVEGLGVCDAHNHVWINPVPGALEGGPVLDDSAGILRDLVGYRQAGGGALVDCQPGGCGRDGRRLLELSRSSSVMIVACTGFHRIRYYPSDFWMWAAQPERIKVHFVREILQGLAECRDPLRSVRAGFIKIAVENQLSATPQAALEAAAEAARETGSALEVHTERGAAAETIVRYFTDRGVPMDRVVLCHMDKRAELPLHADLARAGILLEYDTFYRPQYDPERNVWPLIKGMVEAGLGDSLALATDMADPSLWSFSGGGPGLANFPTRLHRRLLQEGFEPESAKQMMGGSIARRLAKPSVGIEASWN